MRRVLLAALLICAGACGRAASPGQYLFVWAGDSAAKASDFLAVIDANPASPTYASVLTSLPTGAAGTHPHHTEAEMPADGHLLANGFHAGRTWLFDLTQPLQPKIITAFGDLAGYSHPHTYLRLADGNILATFQYKADSAAPMKMPAHGGMSLGGVHTTGGLVQMDERGTVIRSGSAADPAVPDKRIYPYSVLALSPADRAVSTTSDMDAADSAATAEWIQLWRLSDLTLMKSIALKPGPRGDENKYTGEPRLLPDGKSVYIHTFSCGLYLLRGVDGPAPGATFVKGFPGKDCGVPILTAHYWLQTVPATHSLVALDISDAEHPREVSSVAFGDDESPHWIAIDGTGRRVVLNSGGYAKENRLFVVNFDPATGALAIDQTFRDAGSDRPGVNLSQRAWPHGFTGTAAPHGTVFSR
jgi:hypothetical protein